MIFFIKEINLPKSFHITNNLNVCDGQDIEVDECF